MSGESTPPLAMGGMSQQGTTTIVRLTKPKLDIPDKVVICPIVCKCCEAPDVGADGRSLKQACVSKALGAIDKASDNKSWYKPEVNYDMTKSPPSPIMSSDSETKAHDWLPGWIKKWWGADDEHPPFRAGAGMIRRPDVVIVKDPSRSPVQDNIKQVVEIKFPPDSVSPEQQADYESIAGDPNKVVTLKPGDCDCDSGEPNERSPIPKPDPKTLGAGALVLMVIGGLLAL
jgi:hypothetical protein